MYADTDDDMHLSTKLDFLNNLPGGAGIFEVVDGILYERYINDGFFKLVSDTREHRMLIAKDDIMLLVHPGDRQLLGNLIRRAGAGEDDMCETCRIMTGSGGYVWLRMFIRVVKRTGNSMEVYICYTDMQGEMAARESLERNKELLSSAIMSVDMSVWEYDVPTKTVYVREGDPRKHGPTELVLSNVPESLIANGLIHGESIESYRDFFADFIEKKEVISGEALVRNSVNDEYWWEKNTITPVFDEFGILVKGIGTSINISERKAIEKEYELQLKSMENTEMYNVIAKSRSNLTKNKIQYVETSTQNAVNVPFDATFDEAVRRISHAAVTEEERKRFKRIFSRKSILEKYAKGVAEGQVRYRRWGSEQSMIWCETKYIATEEPGTNDCVLFMYSTDITDRMIEEQIVNRISTIEYDGLGVIDVKSGKYKLMNCNQEVDRGGFPKAGRFEENISEWIQKYVFEPDIEDCLKKFKINAIKERLSIEESCVITYSKWCNDKLRRKKFQFFYLDELQRTLVFSRSDITEMYEQEQAQLQKTENALLKAEEANQAKTDFFARMSHDLRTPMNGILGMTELSKNTDDVKELHHNLELIEISGKYMTNLINDILDLQKIESGNLHLKKKLQRCDLFIETIVDMMKPTALRKNIDFQLLNINVNLEQYARIDEIRFQQVFVNIMSNAIKFTPRDGKIKFVMETLSRDSGVEHDKFQIIDNGIGIGEEFLRNGLFNPYSKENNSMTTKYTGSGLGLAITKRIIDSMGGRIEVESHKNVGTTVTVYIDVEVLDNESAKAELEEKTGTLPLERIKGKNILVCEDHPINAEIIKDVLEMAGCQVCVAENGAEGFSAFCEAEKYFYDAILMDIRMPVMAGWEAAKCIRGLVREDASGIPIIALTANAFEEDRQHSLDVGMNDHLAKPIDARKIYETLIHYIG